MTARQIEVQILWDGIENPDLALRSFELDSNRYESCDTAVLTFAIKRKMARKASFWFEQDTASSPWISVGIRDTKISSVWTVLFQGRPDHVRNIDEHSLVEMECRDALAALIDLRVQDSWLNHTGSDLLQDIARSATLETRISLPDDGSDHMMGQFWQVEHKRGALLSQHRFQTAADLAFAVARDALCDLYADGKTLVCQPSYVNDDTAEIIDVRNAVFETDVSRDLQLLTGIVVHMASWDSRQRSSTHIYYDGKTFSQDAPSGVTVLHSFRVPGRRLEDVRRLARGKYERISAHAMSVRISMPGIIRLRPRQFIKISLGTTEQTLGVDQVVSRFSVNDGFIQHVVLRSRRSGA
ncbi:hypothetical protein [Gluconobacter cerinus]|uniref:hypothetical protein n=1 Tax=Gluconobacter cerinus TaxID=38307 RepID=UPI001C053DC3|nr:hypothetical protein [Gluconobacter cerinus]